MKILVIEDNKRLAERIQTMLGKIYVVDTKHTGEDGTHQALMVDYNTIILDLGLPDIQGQQVCMNLRSRGVKTPILILTADDATDTKVTMLDLGADDYLTKPFNGTELRARVSALMRRQTQMEPVALLQVRDLEVDTGRRQVHRSGIPIQLRRKEFDILEYLVINRGRAVTREMILNHAWEEGVESWNNTVDVHIKNIRDKIDRPFASSLIKTAYGIGYMIDD